MEKILIAEDSRRLNKIYERILKEKGYEVLTAFDGEQALDVLKKEKVDLLILDLQMPKMDGVQVLHRINLDYSLSSVKILVVTSKADWKEGPVESMRISAERAGNINLSKLKGKYDELDKPIFSSIVTKKFKEELTAKVEKMLKTKEDDWKKTIVEG